MVQPCRSLRLPWGALVATGISGLKTAQYAALLALSITLLFIAGVGSAHAFDNQVSGAPVHEEITAEGLKFLNAAIIDELKIINVDYDVVHVFESEAHFDNCKFLESSNNINSLYNQAVTALTTNPQPTPADFSMAAEAFGQLLHTVQDFYSHTNWVELQWAGQAPSSLIDAGQGHSVFV